jgi:hypothetical protein
MSKKRYVEMSNAVQLPIRAMGSATKMLGWLGREEGDREEMRCGMKSKRRLNCVVIEVRRGPSHPALPTSATAVSESESERGRKR